MDSGASLMKDNGEVRFVGIDDHLIVAGRSKRHSQILVTIQKGPEKNTVTYQQYSQHDGQKQQTFSPF